MQGSLMIDTRKEAYGTFFKDDFAKKAFEVSDDCNELRRPVFDLISAWRSTSYSGALPSVLVMTLKSFHDGYANEPSSAGMLRYSEVVLAKLCLEIPALTENGELCRSLQSRIVDISAQIVEADRATKLELDSESAWQEYLKLHPFVMGVHATMRQTYLAIFGAYENYIVSLLKIGLGGAPVRVTDRDFTKKFRDVFGDLVESAWLEPRILVAKRVRHAIIHAGGRVTRDLEGQKIPVVVHDDHLHVYPEHNKALYDVLKVPAFAMMRSSVLREKSFKIG
ncbi:MAG: hypothetical protein ACK449_03830 [Planctomycetota bacterium]|jgi:hypothetical protein